MKGEKEEWNAGKKGKMKRERKEKGRKAKLVVLMLVDFYNPNKLK